MEAPRRNRLDLNTPAEKAIYNAMQEVEKVGADVKLTEAVTLLSKARDLVADYVDVTLSLKTEPSNPSKFSDDELACLRQRFNGFSLINGKELFMSTNGGFGSTSITKEKGKIIYYSHAPSSWDQDTAKVYSYRTYKVQYQTVQDCVSGKGTILIDETR